MRIAITGAGGNIGTRLLIRLHDAGIPCCGLIRHMTPRLARRPELDLRRVDFADEEGLASALKDCTVVVHAALDKNPAPVDVMTGSNLRMIASLWRACRQSNPRFIHLSSIAAIPPRVTPETISRDDFFSSEPDWYSQTKVAAEKWLLSHAANTELCMVRAGLVYGPYMHWTGSAISKLQGGTILLPAGRSAPCYAIHVDDLCDLLRSLALRTESPPRILYGINPEPASWAEFFTALAVGVGIPGPAVDYRPLAELQAAFPAQVPFSGLARDTVRWLWRCPLLPTRLKFSRRVQTAIKLAHPSQRAADESLSPPQPPDARPLLWPTRFEMETYLSTAHFTIAQTSVGTAGDYKRKLTDGLRDSIAWWKCELGPLVGMS